MKNKIKSKICFHIDHELIQEGYSHLIEEVIKAEKLKLISNENDLHENFLNIIFTNNTRSKKGSWPKNRVFICSELTAFDGPQVIKCDFMSFQDIEMTINGIFEIEKNIFITHKIRNSEKQLEQLREKNSLTLDSEVLKISSDFELIIDLEIDLLKAEYFSDWNNLFRPYLKKVSWISQMNLMKIDEVVNEEGVLEENSLLLKMPFNDLFLFIKFKNNCIEENSLKIELLINMLLKSAQLIDQSLIRDDDEIDFWKRIFAKISYPMAIVTNLGDLLIYNEHFAKIGILPKECLSFKDQESIEIHQQYYVVKRIDLDFINQKVNYFIFYTSDKVNTASGRSDKKVGIDDLGIVSSSIAHELNNPLAGILAALSLLMLEDSFSNDALADIEEMKNGARRCKELIEIFLGFSRFSPNQKYQSSLKDSLDQATNLLRFRMVESNIRIEMRYSPTLETFNTKINSSVLSMILYLIISEILTAFAHHRLITQQNINNIAGEVLEFNNQIIIRIDESFGYEEKLIESKLIQHLLIFEKMEINFLKKEIRLIYKG